MIPSAWPGGTYAALGGLDRRVTVTIVPVLIVVATVVLLGKEAKGVEFGRPAEARSTT